MDASHRCAAIGETVARAAASRRCPRDSSCSPVHAASPPDVARAGHRPRAERHVQPAAALEAAVGLLPPGLEEQRLAQQAPGEGLRTHHSLRFGQVEHSSGVVLDRVVEPVAIQVVLADAVVQVGDAGEGRPGVGASESGDLLEESLPPAPLEVGDDRARLMRGGDVVLGAVALRRRERLLRESLRRGEVAGLPGEVRAGPGQAGCLRRVQSAASAAARLTAASSARCCCSQPAPVLRRSLARGVLSCDESSARVKALTAPAASPAPTRRSPTRSHRSAANSGSASPPDRISSCSRWVSAAGSVPSSRRAAEPQPVMLKGFAPVARETKQPDHRNVALLPEWVGCH